MKFKSMKSFHALSAWAVAGVLIVASGQSAAAQSTNSDARGIKGTWSVTVTPNDCNGHAIAPSFPALLTFAHGGTLTGIGMPSFILPRQTSPAYGIWSRTGGQTFTSSSLGFITLNGAVVATQKLTLKTIVVGNNPDQWTVDDAVSEFRDPNDPSHILFSSCASGVAQRFE
jgi:hypothetical protein